VAVTDRAVLASRTALTFALTNGPLAAIAIAADRRTPIDNPDQRASAAKTFALKGTALSGPLPPVLVTAALGILGRRRDRFGSAAIAVIGVMGVLITINAARQLAAEPKGYAPRGALVAGGAIFSLFGIAFVVAAVHDLRARRSAFLSS